MNAHVSEPTAATATPRPHNRSATRPRIGPGDKLLCVDDTNLRRTYHPGPPVKGRIYCLRELYTENGVAGVLLAGIQGPIRDDGLECGFLLSRFRWVHA